VYGSRHWAATEPKSIPTMLWMFFEFYKQNKIYRKGIVNLYLTFKPDIVMLAQQKVFSYCALADVHLTVLLEN
jgi:hypothetical protein